MAAILGAVLLLGINLAPRACEITLRVTKLDPTAPRAHQRETAVAEPQVVTHLGRPAVFRLGKLGAGTDGVTGPGAFQLLDGVEIEVVPLPCPNGLVRLEMRVKPVGVEPGFRVETDVRSGAKYRLRVEPDRGTEVMRVEVVVTTGAAVGK